jgi:hypothetical protein
MRVRLASAPPNFMIYLLGHAVEVTKDKTCTRSATDHQKLAQEARADRRKLGFNIEESFALCLRCGMAVPLTL